MNDIAIESEYSSKYIQFYKLKEDIDYLNYDGGTLYNSFTKVDNLDEIITKEFRLFLRAEEIYLNDKYREFAYCLNCNILDKPKLKPKRNWYRKVE